MNANGIEPKNLPGTKQATDALKDVY